MPIKGCHGVDTLGILSSHLSPQPLWSIPIRANFRVRASVAQQAHERAQLAAFGP
jgi:hypothetical protein